MVRIQEMLWTLECDYIGTPYYVSGHAIYNALARHLPTDTARALHVSSGMFVPGDCDSSPGTHSQSGGVSDAGTGLRAVDEYGDLFVYRNAAQRWLADTRPRDAHNTQTLRQFGDRTGYGATRTVGKSPENRASNQTIPWSIHAYCHTDGDGHLPLTETVLDGLRLGGPRSYGFGQTTLEATQCVDVDTLSYARLKQADAYQIELLSPYVLTTEYPGADDQSVPSWWDYDGDLRRRDTRLIEGDTTYTLTTVDHGQVVAYGGNSPITAAQAGVFGSGTHSEYGFGRYRVRPADDDRVPERTAAALNRGDR